eukprot:GDKK01049541.1.p1 GENE.GDKK01049541.1~~GDKK01049541.1.p1  ORF type:complete len:195 (+),score=37.02 GDKK01049541.1:90-587(+)
MSDIGERTSSASFDSISGDCSPELPVQYSRSVEDLNLPPCTLKKIKKKLRFDNLVRVTLIPSITEYKDAGLHLYLWCSQNELQCYKDSAYEDIKEFMRVSQCDNFTVAMKSYFQVDAETEQLKMSPPQLPNTGSQSDAQGTHPLTTIQEASPTGQASRVLNMHQD